MRDLTRLVLASAVATSLVACESTCRQARQQLKYWTGQSTWLATVYPNRSDLTVYRQVGWFKNLEECRAACLQQLNMMGRPWPAVGDYECGLNCEPYGQSLDLWICQETLH